MSIAAAKPRRITVAERMKLTDTNGVRMMRGKSTQAVWKETDDLMWVWDIARRTGRNSVKRELRFLIEEIENPTSNEVILQTSTQVVNRLLGERKSWLIADVADLLLCSQEHAGELKLKRASTKPIRIARETLETFLIERLVNK